MKKVNFIENNEIKTKDFYEPQDNNPNGFNLYTTAAFIGPTHSGKTQAALNMAKYLKENKLVTEIFVLSPTLDNNPFEVLDIDEDHKVYDLDNVNKYILSLMAYCKEKVQKWKTVRNEYTEKQYNKLYKDIYKIYLIQKSKMDIMASNQQNYISEEDDNDALKLTEEDYEILEDNKYNSQQSYYNNGPSFLVIFDDINGSDIGHGTSNSKEIKNIKKLISAHRHNHMNIFLITQNYRSSIPAAVRKMIKIYVMFNMSDANEIRHFHSEIANEVMSDFNEFFKLYRQITSKQYNFMLVDLAPKNKNLSIRKNFNYIRG